MIRRRQARIAWVLGTLAFGLGAGTVVIALSGGGYRAELDSLPFFMVCALVGSLIASRQPENRVGWIVLAGALSFAIMSFSGHYALYGMAIQPGSLPGARFGAWIQTWVWVVGGASLYLLLPFYFPDGRTPTAKLRWFPPAVMVGTVAMAMVAAVTPGDEFIQVQSDPPAIVNPVGAPGLEAAMPALVASVLEVLIPIAIVSALGVAIAALLVRYRQSVGIERQQLKWLALVVGLFPLLLILNAVLGLPSSVFGVYLFCIPVAIGIAVLRHNLYDIDLIINRTLVYGSLTAVVVGLYIFTVGYLGALLQDGIDLTERSKWHTLLSLIATGVVAVMFQPVRDYLQHWANRLVYGQREEPYAVLSRLGQRLEGALAPESMLQAIVETVRDALRLPYTAVILHENGQRVLGAASGTHCEFPLRLPLMHQRKVIGEVVLGQRSDRETFGPVDQRLLVDLARHIGTVAHNVQLERQVVRTNAELQRSREQLVLSTEEERRRLRRELHDGLAPTLAALNLKAGMIGEMMEADRPSAQIALNEWREDIRGTIASVRRLAYDLRPPILDELGLVAAISEHAANMKHDCSVTVHDHDVLERLPAAVEVAAFRIVQEALVNIDRHARASSSKVELWLCQTPRQSLCIEVVDDGAGFISGAAFRPGIGLLGMHERAAELGGSCTVEPHPVGGTRVHAVLPLVPGAKDD